MKIKNILVVLLLVGVSQSVMATKFSVINKSSGDIMIRPRWTGSQERFFRLTPGQSKDWDSGSHYIRFVDWADMEGVKNKDCWLANVGDQLSGLLGRFRTNVKIEIKDIGKYTIDLKGTGVNSPPKQAEHKGFYCLS